MLIIPAPLSFSFQAQTVLGAGFHIHLGQQMPGL
jgi:hypothetical protein